MDEKKLTINQLKSMRDVPVILASEEGFITYVNEKFTSVFGWTNKESMGSPLTLIIPSSLRDAHHMGFSRFISTGQPTLLYQTLKLKAVNKKGEEFDAEHFIIAEKKDGHWIIGATVKPVL